ncbi:MAG: nitrate reductase cytochrome c-type subunit [Deltaproteobacteria bacterium]|nr:nitrate reductase cytochrome c-type subunit [Deltaproteobacteria bacterium]MBW2422315.1 nitrate reductase cytochrome c-type subunit [Deltaproteobacteria bacterium]
MRRRAQLSFWLPVILAVPLLLVAAGGDKSREVDDGMDIYFRETALLALSEQELPAYPETDAGEAKKIDRAFADAPPQIPHTTEDMYPITGEDNECLNCHHPDNAVSKADSPLPETHFERAVMAKGGPSDAMVWKVASYETVKDVVGARYNCSMCHTPQASNVATPATSFVPLKRK